MSIEVPLHAHATVIGPVSIGGSSADGPVRGPLAAVEEIRMTRRGSLENVVKKLINSKALVGDLIRDLS